MKVVLIVNDIAFGPLDLDDAPPLLLQAHAKDMLAFVAPLYPAEDAHRFLRPRRRSVRALPDRTEAEPA
jgi:hypothetical protein